MVRRTRPKSRDVKLPAHHANGSSGRKVIAVIGIDRYRDPCNWQPLDNAVNDATHVAKLFQRLGFEQATEPLLDDRATGEAMRSLVIRDLTKLSTDDSLVVFFAGHGGTYDHEVADTTIKTGYLIPFDGAKEHRHTLINLETWLNDIAALPAKTAKVGARSVSPFTWVERISSACFDPAT